jgi:hypothetical protein
MLPTHDGYTLEEITEKAKTAHLVGKNPNFFTGGKGAQFMGMPVPDSTRQALGMQ